MTEIHHRPFQKTIQDLVHLHKNGKLELSPGFQRKSVWNKKDREKLIDSILRRWPIPAIFLYRRHREGDPVYDVIDGKQRLESILGFVGEIRGARFKARVLLPNSDETETVDWVSLKKQQRQHLILGYSLTIIEVDGDLGEIIDLFVRLNSTGKALTAAEKRHAKFYNSPFLKEADRIATRFLSYFQQARVVSPAQISRMKHVELVCELMVSADQGDVVNKKAVLDKVMGANDMTPARIKRTAERTIRTLNLLPKMFPDLHTTRFVQLSDFYSLAVLVSKFDSEHLILTDRGRNALGQDLLTALSNGVDQLRDQHKKLGAIADGSELYRDYLFTVLEGTDEISKRRRREQILRGLLESLFIKKDDERLFTAEQRRILWNTASDRRCSICRKPVTWSDLQIDHIKPHTKGGRTSLENAALAHRSCNASKGART